MARDRKPPPSNDPAWERTLLLFQSGSPEFVEQLRQRVTATTLAPFAETWYTDTRIEARRLLFAELGHGVTSLSQAFRQSVRVLYE